MRRLATVRGVALTNEDRLRRSIIERLMCDFQVDLTEIASRFDRNADGFEPEIQAIDELAQDGIVARNGLTVAIPEESRALVRNVCAATRGHCESPGRRAPGRGLICINASSRPSP